MSKARRNLNRDEKVFIEENWQNMTDKEIGAYLGRPSDTVQKFRLRQGFVKNTGALIEKMEGDNLKDASTVLDEIDRYKNLDPSQYRQVYEQEFRNTHQYKILEEMLDANEIDYYMQEFIQHIIEVKQQGGTLTTSEYRALDAIIHIQIRRIRLATHERRTLNLINTLNTRAIELTDRERQQLLQLNLDLSGITKEIKLLNDQFIDMQKSLNMTRQERLKRMSDQDISIMSLIEEIMNDKRNESISAYSDAMQKAKQKTRQNWVEEGILRTVEKDDEEKN